MKLNKLFSFLVIIILLYTHKSSNIYYLNNNIYHQDDNILTNNNYKCQTLSLKNNTMKLHKNTKSIHNIYITNKIVPLQLFIEKNAVVKWINETNKSQKVVCNYNNGDSYFISKQLKPCDYDYVIFNKEGKYNFYLENIISTLYEIIVQ